MADGHTRKRRWGDRKDGYLIRNVDGLYKIIPHIMPNRTEAEVYTNIEMDVTKLMEFLKERNSNESEENRTKFFHCILMSVAKIFYFRPQLNRFICGRRMYEHKDIKLGFTSKKQFSDESKDILITITAEEDWTLRKVTDYVTKSVHDSRMKESSGSDAVDRCAKLPRCVLMVMGKFLRFLNFYGWVPSSISNGDPNFTSVLLSNLGSINGPVAYHHLNNYGTTSSVITISTISERRDADGTVHSIVSLGITFDERVADGFYLIRSLKFLQYILDNPELLDRPLAEAVDYNK